MSLRTLETWPHGALLLDAEHTRFTLWAPDAERVSLELNGERLLPMPRQPDGWFVLETRCAAGTRYRYCIDDGQYVPDPASRAQAQDVHSHSLVVDPLSYHWRHPDWRGRPWHEAVIYELHVGALGGYRAVEEQLPRLVALGVTAIELMPLAEFPGERNWGYDGVLLYAPQSSYGSPDDLKHLIDSAHGLGLMVILDVVYNHFGPDGNYLQLYARGFFNTERQTPWGEAINYGRRQVSDFFIDNALMWLFEYRFDGLRLDAVHAIDDPVFLRELAHQVRQRVESARHIWLTVENEFNQVSLLENGYDAQWNDDGHNTLHVLLTGETHAYYADFAHHTTAKLALCLSQGLIYQGHPNRHGRARGEPSAHLPPTSFVLFLQNHDQIGNRVFGERLNQLCPPAALRAATTLLLLSPMIPLLFMGDEVAASEPFLYFTSHTDELAEAVRQGRQQEHPHFFGQDSLPDLPDPNASQSFQRSRPVFEPRNGTQRTSLELYQQLLHLRQREITPGLPGARALGARTLAEGALFARWRLGDGRVLRIDLNLSSHPVPHTPPEQARLLFESTQGAAQQLQHRVLAPYCALVTLSAAEGLPTLIGTHS